ncbi:hypothetical protein pipiens_005599 [Culex pipiens pipiens]|uniref:Peptidase M41 FtsH extracellular domain-containing protein n=1 Tax=Culex pipiens pipiens TaxID=38569 RepID=A0ABD1DV88_CULPP
MAYRLLTTARKLESTLTGLGRQHRTTVNTADCDQLIRSLSYLQSSRNKVWNDFLHRIQLFCEKPPKGFEKYYKGGKKPPAAAAEAAGEASGKSAKPADGAGPAKESPSQPPKNDWNLGMFGPQPARGKQGGSSGGGGGGGSGRPIGGGEGGDKEKMIIFGALAGVALISTIAYFEMGYKEIAWKEFVNNYLARGIVDKLEVVNKKWVRVRLTPGNVSDSNGTLWFNIGSVDSFERNLESAQSDMNIEAVNFVPVIYRSEIEASSLTGLLPTLLIIGFLIYMMRRSSEMMGGGRGGRKGGGLFGGVMQSTAKLINANEINVGFK